MQFMYTEPLLLPFWKKWNRLLRRSSLPPSQLVPMSMGEFISRMQQERELPNCLYPEEGDEFYYMQSSLTNGMLPDINLYAPPLSCLGAPGAAGTPEGLPAFSPTGLQIAQIPRLFVSPAGAVSPLHYDTASSFLTQIRGRKRLILYAPSDLQNLYPYSRLHILRRRCKVNPVNPDHQAYPRFKQSCGIEALLEPGDVLWFPGYWSHYTESVDFSMSMTYRFWTEEQQKSMKRGLIGLLRN